MRVVYYDLARPPSFEQRSGDAYYLLTSMVLRHYEAIVTQGE
jgi:hypothetical protein